jgi:hypothetical protein
MVVKWSMRVNRGYFSFGRYFCKNTMGINISGILVMALLILGSGSIYGIPFLGIAAGAPGPYTSITPPLPSSSGKNLSGIIGDAFVYLSNNIVNSTAYYDVVFRTGSADNVAKIDVVFPSGTGVRNVRIIEVSGVSVGSSSVNGQTVTYTIKSAPLIQAGATIRLEFANVLNPPSPNLALKVQVTTKTSAGSIIDSGMSSTYLIRQIRTGDIAPDAKPRVYFAISGNVTVGPEPGVRETDSAYANCGTGIPIAGGYVWLDLIGGVPNNTVFSAFIVNNGPDGHSWEVTAQSTNWYSHKNTSFYAYATCLLLP